MKVCAVLRGERTGRCFLGKRETIMIDHRISLSSAVVLSASLLATGCSSKDGGDSAALGRAQAAVTNVPSDGSVACIAITSTGSWV